MSPILPRVVFTTLGCAFLFCALPAAQAQADATPEIGVREGQLYPDFMLPRVDGDIARLSDYRGKKILLFHFASW